MCVFPPRLRAVEASWAEVQPWEIDFAVADYCLVAE